MFEIPDNEDEFWENLPLDESENKLESETRHQDITPTSSLTRNPSASIYPLLSPVSRNTSCAKRKTLGENLNDESSSGRSKKESKSKRKFPGPAGILPENALNVSNASCPPENIPESLLIHGDTGDKEAIPPSQSSSSYDVFSSMPWKSLVSDIGSDFSSILKTFSIKSMLFKADKRMLPKGKIPLLFAFMDSVDFHGSDGSVLLRDPTGKVCGALHHDLIKDPTTALKPGIVVVLRQTSVISPSPRTHYLNITPANIVVIYSLTRDSTVRKSEWSSSPSELLTHNVLPSLTKIIHESDIELKSALNKLAHQETNTHLSSHTRLTHQSFSPSNVTIHGKHRSPFTASKTATSTTTPFQLRSSSHTLSTINRLNSTSSCYSSSTASNYRLSSQRCNLVTSSSNGYGTPSNRQRPPAPCQTLYPPNTSTSISDQQETSHFPHQAHPPFQLPKDVAGIERAVKSGGGYSVDGRDAKIQLGASKMVVNEGKPMETPNYGIWDDDLDDELLSQL